MNVDELEESEKEVKLSHTHLRVRFKDFCIIRSSLAVDFTGRLCSSFVSSFVLLLSAKWPNARFRTQDLARGVFAGHLPRQYRGHS